MRPGRKDLRPDPDPHRIAAECAIALVLGLATAAGASPAPVRPPLEAAFSPTAAPGTLRALLRREIRAARSSIEIALYTGMTAGTAVELARAAREGRRLRVLVDPDALSREETEEPPRQKARARNPTRPTEDPDRTTPRWLAILGEAGVPVRAMPVIAGKDGIRPDFHHKFAVIDGATVLTGSWNWSAKGDGSNYENLVVIRDAGLAGRFAEEFERLWVEAGAPRERPAPERRPRDP